MDEADTAEYRLRYEASVFGSADEAFEPRWERIRTIVRSHHRAAVQEAWRDAIHAGWTQQELQSAGFGDSPER
jgi:hypothetical protein